MAAAPHPVRITVVEVIRGECPMKFRVGDVWEFQDAVPTGFCATAFHALMPWIWTLRFGGNSPWDDPSGSRIVCCPDAATPVSFKLERIPAR